MKTVRLGDIGNIVTGKTPSSKEPQSYGNEYLFITPSDNFDEKYIKKTIRYLSEYGKNSLSGKLLKENSILVTCIGSAMGKVAINKFPAITNQQINSIEVKLDFDTDYIYYCLKNNYALLRNASSGSTALPILNKTDFENLSLKIHKDLKTQQSIAKILSQLDQKIALNNQINAQLEQMAKTLYEYWFVQFDFPDENGKPYKSSGGAMIYNEQLKREIPKGWGVGVLSEWIKNDKNGDWGKENNQGNYQLKVICIRGADINTIKNSGNIDAPNRFILNKNSDKIIDNYEFVIEISGGSPTQSTGRIAPISPYVIDRFKEPLICSNFCKIISLTNKYYFYNFYFLWKSIYDNDVLFGWEGKTSGIKNLLFDNFINNHIDIMPNADIVKNFFERIDIINQKQNVLLKQNQQLTQLRDFLLPMLMNGQVGVRDE